MNASMSASSPGRCSGKVKSTVLSSRSRHAAVQGLLPHRRQGRDGVFVADLDAEHGWADKHRGEVLEQQGEGGSDVLGIQVCRIAVLLGAEYGGGDDVHA